MLAVPLALLVLAADPGVVTEADVRPLWGDGPLAAAKQAFDAERWEEAERAFAGSPSPEARYLRAVALVWVHRGEEAVQALSGLGEALPAVADRVQYWTGRALDEAGRRREASEAYARVPEGSFLWAEARLGRARALHALGDAAAAEAAVAPLLAGAAPPDLSRPDAAATALLLAGQIRASGEGRAAAGEARKAFLACWAHHPIAPESQIGRAHV
jgi:soluble lytic murein transglycosylase